MTRLQQTLVAGAVAVSLAGLLVMAEALRRIAGALEVLAVLQGSR